MSATLPPLPSHPEPRIMKWSALELDAIRSYGEQCAAAARLAEREECARVCDDKERRKLEIRRTADALRALARWTAPPPFEQGVSDMDTRTTHHLGLIEAVADMAPISHTDENWTALPQRLRGRGEFLLNRGRVKDAELMFDAATEIESLRKD